MTETISVRLREEQLKELKAVEKKWQIDRSEVIRRLLAEALKQWSLQNALERLAAHRISIGKAAEEAGISIWEMLDLAKERKIDWVGLTIEDIEEDLKIIRKIK